MTGLTTVFRVALVDPLVLSRCGQKNQPELEIRPVNDNSQLKLTTKGVSTLLDVFAGVSLECSGVHMFQQREVRSSINSTCSDFV